jgi:ribosomal protein L29
MSTNKIDFKNMNIDELKKQIESMRAELFGLRLSAATQPVKNYSQFSRLRRNIARALTAERQIAAKVD